MALTFDPKIDFGAMDDFALPNVTEFPDPEMIMDTIVMEVPLANPRLLQNNHVGFRFRVRGVIAEDTLQDAHDVRASLEQALRGTTANKTFTLYKFAERRWPNCHLTSGPSYGEPKAGLAGLIEYEFGCETTTPTETVVSGEMVIMPVTCMQPYAFQFNELITGGRTATFTNSTGRDLTVIALAVTDTDGAQNGSGTTSLQVNNGSDAFSLSLAYNETEKVAEGEISWAAGTTLDVICGNSAASAGHYNLQGHFLAEG